MVIFRDSKGNHYIEGNKSILYSDEQVPDRYYGEAIDTLVQYQSIGSPENIEERLEDVVKHDLPFMVVKKRSECNDIDKQWVSDKKVREAVHVLTTKEQFFDAEVYFAAECDDKEAQRIMEEYNSARKSEKAPYMTIYKVIYGYMLVVNKPHSQNR